MRTAEDLAVFKQALKAINKLYASLTATLVLKLTDIPDRPTEYDGWVTIFQPPSFAHQLRLAMRFQSIEESDSDEAAARADLGRFGEVLELRVMPSPGHKGGYGRGADGVVEVRFASHTQAEGCVAALQAERRGASTVYNETAYSRKHGNPYSGWCVPCSSYTSHTLTRTRCEPWTCDSAWCLRHRGSEQAHTSHTPPASVTLAACS